MGEECLLIVPSFSLSDAATRQAAEQELSAAAQNNYPVYMSTLATELANEGTASHLRNAAGLAIKNALSAREAPRSAEYAERWFKLSMEERNDIKQKAFATLASQDSKAGQSSAQVLASIASVELPMGQSQDMIGQLLSQMGDVNNVNLRRATLQAIGFICETSVSGRAGCVMNARLATDGPSRQQSESLSSQSNEILTAVIQGARKEEGPHEVQLAALQALFNSLEFVKSNFERDGERKLHHAGRMRGHAESQH
ncbi:hypothetical protein L7F22_052011 [Adiantum nelumboides]|nr:hypothetical protein [Adiantum nelumboides]